MTELAPLIYAGSALLIAGLAWDAAKTWIAHKRDAETGDMRDQLAALGDQLAAMVADAQLATEEMAASVGHIIARAMPSSSISFARAAGSKNAGTASMYRGGGSSSLSPAFGRVFEDGFLSL